METILSQALSPTVVSILNEMQSTMDVLKVTKCPSEQSKKLVNDLIEQFHTQFTDLSFYSDISSSELISFNIYSYFENTFKAKRLGIKNDKHVKFFMSSNTQRKTEVPKDLADDIFTLHNCLPSIKAVFENICDNAIKYMPDGSDLCIECCIIGKTKEFKFINPGPHLDSIEYDNILRPGVRGENASKILSISGQGLGLSQIRPILQLHKEWINTTFTIRPSVFEPTILNGIPYSNFILVLSFEPISGIEDEPLLVKTIDTIPEGVFHNVMKLLTNIVDIYGKSIKSINFDNNARNSLKQSLFHLNKNKYDILLMQYVWFQDVSEDIIFGNRVLISIDNYIRASVWSINREYGRTVIDCHGDCNSSSFMVPTSFFSLFSQLLIILINSVTIKDQVVHVDLEQNRLLIYVDQPAMFDIDDQLETDWEKIDINCYHVIGLNFCLDMLEFNGQKHSITKSANEYYVTMVNN